MSKIHAVRHARLSTGRKAVLRTVLCSAFRGFVFNRTADFFNIRSIDPSRDNNTTLTFKVIGLVVLIITQPSFN